MSRRSSSAPIAARLEIVRRAIKMVCIRIQWKSQSYIQRDWSTAANYKFMHKKNVCRIRVTFCTLGTFTLTQWLIRHSEWSWSCACFFYIISQKLKTNRKNCVHTDPKLLICCCFNKNDVPIDAIARHISIADTINNGLRPALSTTNTAAMLLTNCTSPTRIVARCSFIELPARI